MHDTLGTIIHCKLARNCDIESRDKWYKHEPESVLDNENY